MRDTQFSGTSLKIDEIPVDVSAVMLSLSEEEWSITVKMSAGF